MDGVVHTTACASVRGGSGAVIMRGSAPSSGGNLRRGSEWILQPDLVGDHDQLRATSWLQHVRPILGVDLGDRHHAFIMPLCSTPSMLFAGASTARSARPSGIDGASAQRGGCSYVMVGCRYRQMLNGAHVAVKCLPE